MSRSTAQPEHPPKVTDLLIRQKCEAMIEYGYVALRQFPKFERHVLAAEVRAGGITGSTNHPGGAGGSGALRIIWGAGRSYPSTNTADV